MTDLEAAASVLLIEAERHREAGEEPHEDACLAVAFIAADIASGAAAVERREAE